MPDQGFDPAHVRVVLRRNERQGVAGGAGARRTADAVHVVLGDVRQVVVHHVADIFDVDTAAGDVGGDHDPAALAAERLERLGALGLAAVAVQNRHGVAAPLEMARQLVGAVLGAGEHEGQTTSLGLEKMRHQLALAHARHGQERLPHAPGGRRAARCHLDVDRIAQNLACQTANLVGHRGREQKRLAPGREGGDDAAHVADEPHVEHAVGLVQDQDLQAPEIDVAPLHEIEKPPRRGHENIDTAAQPLLLRLEADPAVDDRRVEPQVAAVDPQRLADLKSQLARGRQNQGPQPAARSRAQAVQDRQGEGGGLAGSRLGAADQVAPGEDAGDGAFLDGCGRLVPLVAHGALDLRREAQWCE